MSRSSSPNAASRSIESRSTGGRSASRPCWSGGSAVSASAWREAVRRTQVTPTGTPLQAGVYIDGFNLYYGGRGLMGGAGKPGWRWLVPIDGASNPGQPGGCGPGRVQCDETADRRLGMARSRAIRPAPRCSGSGSYCGWFCPPRRVTCVLTCEMFDSLIVFVVWRGACRMAASRLCGSQACEWFESHPAFRRTCYPA